ASSQIGDFLGLRTGPVPIAFVDKWGAYLRALATFNSAAIGLGAATLALIILLRRFVPRFPAYLIAIVGAAAAAALLDLPVDTVGDRFPSMPSGLPLPHLPHISLRLARVVPPRG